ncbi:MAG TPA: amino acid permease [Ktedonobacteraceae bacterium]|nr:amino acid permease [Ktedonobacteraceae bacterium]
MNKHAGQYTPTILQTTIGEPLRSEQRTNEFLPRVLSRVDMLVIFLAIVLFIPNASVVQATQGAGGATYFYWVIGTVTFLVPGAIITAQLYRLMPVDGAIYIWTHRALGPLWGFFAGVCAWFPGILVLLSTSDIILSLIQGISAQIDGAPTNWLMTAWQQGFVVLIVLLFAGLLSLAPLQWVMKIAKWVILVYGISIFIVGMAGVIWLLQGHAPQVSLTNGSLAFGGQNIVLYGVIILALLGVEVPLNMAAETKQPNAGAFFLRWGPLLVLLAYLLGTFGVMVVVPAGSAGSEYSTLIAVKSVFGVFVSALIGLSFISFFVMATVIYNVSFARILFVSALDHRFPPSLAKVNRYAAPYRATTLQIAIVALIAVFTYFISPLLYPVNATNLSADIYNVSQATTTVIWCISMLFLFVDLPILLTRFRELFAKRPELLITRPWILYLCTLIGGIASIMGIWTTLTKSWDSQLISNSDWLQFVGISTLVCLVVGLIGSAYPRLLGSLNEQTAAARENARLYNELSQAYARLSELDQLKDAFLTTASHELRTPLTIVQGYLELLGEIDEGTDPAVRRSFLNKARRACDELVLLQANIMDASRIQFDTATLISTTLQLQEVCTAVIDLFEPLIVQEERSMEANIAPTISVLADETRLKQVLRNLIANALRYSPPQTPICITAKVLPQEDMVEIRVIDHGSGIPPDKQEAIFDKFVRLERDMHGIVRGSGLGLYITRQLVEAMKGTIRVESSGKKGAGSTFIFTLPVAK